MIGLLAPLLWLAAGAVAAAALVPAARRDRLEHAALAVGLGLVIVAGVALLGFLPPLVLVAVILLVALAAPAVLFIMHRRDSLPFLPAVPGDDRADSAGDGAPDAMSMAPSRRTGRALVLAAVPVLALLLVAGGLRLVNLGYSEYQGVEARALLLAERLTQSRDLGTLLWHKKGPLEILLPAAAVKRGDLRESTARLPFALAGLGVVLAGLALGRRLWGPRAGFAAALVLALDGYLIAFSRIVQYQSVVALCSVLAVWAAWRWYTAERREIVWLPLAALFLAFGTWAHYEAVFAGLPVAYLVLSRARRERWRADTWLRTLAPPVLLGAGLVAVFYLPFALHPQFAETLRYIAERRLGVGGEAGGGGPYYKLGDYFLRASFYNASYYVIAMLLALVAVTAARLRTALGRFGWAGVAAWLVALALLIARPELFASGERSFAVLVFLPVLIAILASPRIDAAWRTVTIWFAGPFFVAAFFTLKPHTHFYTMVSAWALMVGWGADRAIAWAEVRGSARPARALAVAVGVVFVAVSGWYLYTVFIQNRPEYKRVFPEARLPGYWLPYGDEPPRGGYFGFPYRAGWNEVRALFADGTLQGSYDSNEELLITGWYTGGAVRCPSNPRYYLVAWRPQDEEDIPDRAEIERTHHLKATIRVNGQEKLWVYDREPVVGAPLVIDDHGGLGSMGGEASTFLGRPAPVSQALELPLSRFPADVRFDHRLRLVGFDVTGLVADDTEDVPRDAASGGESADDASGAAGAGPPVLHLPAGTDRLGVTLAWEPYAPMDRDYRVTLVVVDPHGETAGVGGDIERIECDGTDMTDWQVGERHFTGHVLRLDRQYMRPGDYVVKLTLHDRASGAAAMARGPEQGLHIDEVDLLHFRVEAP